MHPDQKAPLKHFFQILLLLLLLGNFLPLQAQYRPDEDLGELFEAVQLLPVFPDSKTFVDCVPRMAPAAIVQVYQKERTKPNFDLKAFVQRYFEMPPTPATNFSSDTSLAVADHIEKLWPVLTRQPGTDGGSLLPLPYPYIVPGGRFREIYYWDSYFTMLGLQASGKTELIQHMVDNFTHLINTTGHIPNGNRSYYVTRSQPPFYALMLRVLAQQKGRQVLRQYAPALLKEYQYWMEGANTLTAANPAHRRVVRLPDGSILNRYWDDKPAPRPEAYKEDVMLAKGASNRSPEDVYLNLKAAAESGWDFSSRWFADGENLATIQTTQLVPVDLNALLYHMELTLADMAGLEGKGQQKRLFRQKANARKKALLAYCWNPAEAFFFDYNFVKGSTTDIPVLAAVFPLYFCMATKKQAAAVATRLQADFV
ncbi:trehalase, partial [Pontibacter qinzhouensis]